MNDLVEALRRAAETIPTPVPDAERVRRMVRRRRTRRKVTAGVVAFVVAAAGLALVVGALRDAAPRRTRPATVGPLDPASLHYAWSVQIEDASGVGEVLQDDERIFVPTATGVVAYPKECSDPCEPAWRLEVATADANQGVNTNLVLGDGLLAVTAGGRLAVANTDCGVEGDLCPVLWYAEPAAGSSGYFGPVISDGVVKATTNQGNAPDNTQTAVAFDVHCREDAGQCSPLWQAELGSGAAHHPAPAVGGVFYQQVGTRMLGFLARCRTDGGPCNPDFEVESTGDPQTQASDLYGPILRDGTLVIGSGDGSLYGYPEHCGSSCSPMWVTPIASNLGPYPAPAGDLVVVSHDGGVTAIPFSCARQSDGACNPAWRATLRGYWSVQYADENIVVAANFRGPAGIAVLPTNCLESCEPMWTTEIDERLNAVASDGTSVFLSDGRRVVAYPAACSDPCEPTWSADLDFEVWNFLIDDARLVMTNQIGYVGLGVTVFAGTQGQSDPTDGVSSEKVCFESESSGDFDGDGRTDTATLHALVAFDRCAPEALGTDWRFELTVEFGSGSLSVPFADCPSLFDCELLEGSDFNGDGRSELPVMLSMASTSYTGLYRVNPEMGVEPLELAAPGDPGFLETGPIRLGGGQDAIQQAGFECRVQDDGSRVVVAWMAERDDGVSPFRVHLTTLELRGDEFVVVATEDQEDVTNLPALHGICDDAS